MNNPKFGYHWIWMLPIAYITLVYDKVCDFCVDIYRQIKIKMIYKRNPEIEKISKLAGTKK